MIRRSGPSQNLKETSDREEHKVDFFSTGSVALNLAASQIGRKGGWARGHIINIVGDGSTGKTMLAIEGAAYFYYSLPIESSNFAPVKKKHIIYNNAEGVMDFPLEGMYGEDFVGGVEWIRTETVEAFGRDIHRRVLALKSGEALLYVADSIDAMVSEVGKKRAEDEAAEKKVQGSYGAEKAKYMSSEFFNNLCNMMAGKDVTLMIISQVRENLQATPFGKKYYRTGGKALDFYTHQVAWLYQIEKLKETYHKRERVYGVRVRAKFERNKVALPFREMELPILFDYGVDDVGAMADYIFGPKNKSIEIGGWSGMKSELGDAVDKNPKLLPVLARKMEVEWAETEAAVRTKRARKYCNGRT